MADISELLAADEDEIRAKSGLHITTKGLNVLAKALAGKELQFTRVALGDSVVNGVTKTPTDAQILNLTALYHECDITLPLVDCRFAGNGAAVVSFKLDNANVTQGFWARELGLFANDPDTGNEILYSYKNFGNLASYIIGGGGAVSQSYILHLITVVDQATNVTAVLDATLINVTQADFSEHINSTTPHPNIPKPAQELTASNYFWATGSDAQLHPISKYNLTRQIIGDDLLTLETLKNRTAQVEINIANLYSQLKADSELNLDANLLVVEDFVECDTLDRLAIQVDDSAAGANTVCTQTIEGIVEGAWYTISDGVRSEYVQVTSVARNITTNLYTIFFASDLTNTYNLKKTYLYRTTGLVTGQKVSGSGDVNNEFLTVKHTFKGNRSTDTNTLTFAPALKNITYEGDANYTGGIFSIE